MLMILDGWGINSKKKGNAFKLADTPALDRLERDYPSTRLRCAGEAVGLPEGIMGNSEVGHLNIGAGRVVYQDLLRIDRAIADGSFFENPAFSSVMAAVSAGNAALHLIGLVSDGGVHRQLTHLTALLDMAREKDVSRVFVHAILDGRDTPPESGAAFVKMLQDHIENTDFGSIASICGRFWAMDRDNRWDRVERAYHLYTAGEGIPEKDPVAAVEAAYLRKETDEFVKPIVMTRNGGVAEGTIQDGDGAIFFNFRADRARQITHALTDPDFDAFERKTVPRLCGYVCMTLYDARFTLPIAFSSVHMEGILGQVISENGLRQLRIAETEKYAHVTYFFNGGEEEPFPGEDRCLIPSPREVATYDQKPEMSAFAVADEVVRRVASDRYDLIIVNFANMDMVGHSGILAAAVKACEAVDRCVGKIVPEVLSRGGVVLITADHGNSEKMVGDNGQPHTAHTLNPVRLVLVDKQRKGTDLREGRLGDIAPTLLEIMDMHPPGEMTGKSLLEG